MSRRSALAQQIAKRLNAERETLARRIVERHYQLEPELQTRYGELGRVKCLQDAHYHLAYLAQAVATGIPSLFADYVAWAKVMLAARNVPPEDLARNLEVMREVLDAELPEPERGVARQPLDHGLRLLPELAASLPSLLEGDRPLDRLAKDYLQALLQGHRQTASRLILAAVEAGTDIRDLYLDVFQKSQHEIGRLWQMNQLSVAQEHFCTAATQMIMSQLYPHIFTTKRNGLTLVAACVSDDLHEIGVRMIADFFEMHGWDTYYLGASTPTSSLVQTVAQQHADVLAVSVTLTSHVRAVADVIQAVRASKPCADVRILVGGYPFNVAPELYLDLGADGCARDARQAVALAEQLAGNGRRS